MRALHLQNGHFGEINVVSVEMLPLNGHVFDKCQPTYYFRNSEQFACVYFNFRP